MLKPVVIFATFGVLITAQLIGMGIRKNGETLLHRESARKQSTHRDDITLAFFFDGRGSIENISYVAIESEADTNSFRSVTYGGGAGFGEDFIDFTLTAVNATYYQASCFFYGFYEV